MGRILYHTINMTKGKFGPQVTVCKVNQLKLKLVKLRAKYNPLRKS